MPANAECEECGALCREEADGTKTPVESELADLGRALLKAVEVYADEGWSPADCPSEIIGDLRNDRDEAMAALRKVRQFVADDAAAISYQSLAQYRSAVLAMLPT